MYLSILQACFHIGGGGGNLGGNFGTVLRPSILKATPIIIYMAFEKYDLFIYLIVHNVDIFIWYPLVLYSSA